MQTLATSEETAIPRTLGSDELALIPPASLGFAQLMDAIAEAPSCSAKDAVPVLGKRVSKKIGKGLAQYAAETILSGFSVFEIARIIQDPRFALSRYMEFLSEIRDNPEIPARDRLAAGDKIIQTILSVISSSAGELKQITSSEPPQNLMNILVQVQGSPPDARATSSYLPELPSISAGESVLSVSQEQGGS